jgi:hypothetical protein
MQGKCSMSQATVRQFEEARFQAPALKSASDCLFNGIGWGQNANKCVV